MIPDVLLLYFYSWKMFWKIYCYVLLRGALQPRCAVKQSRCYLGQCEQMTSWYTKPNPPFLIQHSFKPAYFTSRSETKHQMLGADCRDLLPFRLSSIGELAEWWWVIRSSPSSSQRLLGAAEVRLLLLLPLLLYGAGSVRRASVIVKRETEKCKPLTQSWKNTMSKVSLRAGLREKKILLHFGKHTYLHLRVRGDVRYQAWLCMNTKAAINSDTTQLTFFHISPAIFSQSYRSCFHPQHSFSQEINKILWFAFIHLDTWTEVRIHQILSLQLKLFC